ncbi:hypothetical protein DYB37_004258 [Aphanomyces astaci]|uniref:START domain-containing protein n=1 Tax=Aphanomyces astaci TaxID=112090 RepID=A0A397C4D6_APHAT|nr:hypothetical protein DYB36_005904 [Aphanomyces astaci]RHY14151.1 hypothetical protein DYB25_001160 [Aphanomyces astaci]RHY39521.1 hypothetical protein DYB30_010795 [Aphanomyces astaci]RHY46166.1 hypothetical protein DYB34_010805 [Aphanomyces astaci]RHY46828.1 hypothetical protein DYB38_010668 [Aphanomyces astaci]
MSSTASQSSRQRLPPDFFMCPDLSSAAQWDLVRRSQQALVDLTQKTRLHGGPITWTLDHESNGVLVYRGNDPFLPLEASSVLLRVTDVRGTLDDMAELLRQPDGAATYHKALTVDCQTLYRIQPPVPQNTSSLVVQWRGLQPSSVHRRRDVCMLEVTFLYYLPTYLWR